MKQSKNILLIYPEIPNNTYWSFKYALRFIGKKSTMPPLGLITVAALFPDHYNLKLVDMNIEPLEEKEVQKADYVFISAMIVQKQSMARVIEICNRIGYDKYSALVDTMPDEFTWHQLYTFLSNPSKAEPECQHEYILVTDGRAFFDEGGYNDNLIDRVVCCKCGQEQPERDDENVN